MKRLGVTKTLLKGIRVPITAVAHRPSPSITTAASVDPDQLDGNGKPLIESFYDHAEDHLMDYRHWTKKPLELIHIRNSFASPELKKIFKQVSELLSSEHEVHPFIETAHNIFFGSGLDDLHFPGLLSLLVAKASGQVIHSNGGVSSTNLYFPGNLCFRQLLLAKALVQSAAAFDIHRTIQEKNEGALGKGNKYAVLCGDLLIVNTIKDLSLIGNNKVLGWIMDSLIDYTDGEATLKTWKSPSKTELRVPDIMETGEPSLIANGLKASLFLSGHHVESQEIAKAFGSAVGALWKLQGHFHRGDLQAIKQQEVNDNLGKLSSKARSLLYDSQFISYRRSNDCPVRGFLDAIIQHWSHI